MKKSYILLSCLVSLLVFVSCKSVPAPQWFDDYRSVYPDSMYIAQIGNSDNADSAKTEALGTISRYLKTTVSSNLETSLKSYSYNGEFSEEQTVLNDVSVASNVELFGVEFTEPYYSKENKRWYCVAYIDRNKAWTQYQPKIENARDSFYNFFNKAVENSDYLLRYKDLVSAEEQSVEFLSCLEYGRLLSVEKEAKYSQDRADIARIPALKEESIHGSSVSIVVDSDRDNQIYSALTDVCNEIGLPVQKNGSNGRYVLNATADMNDYLSGDLFVIYPSIEISLINEDDNTIYSYSNSLDKIAAYNENAAFKRGYKALAGDIKENLQSDFNSFMGIKK